MSPVKWHLETWDRLGRDLRREVRACVGAGGGRPSQDLWADSCRVTVVLQGWATFQEGPGPSFLSWGGRKGSSIACKLPYLLLGHQACLPHCSPSVPGRPGPCPAWSGGRRPGGTRPPAQVPVPPLCFPKDDSSQTHQGGFWAVYHRPALAAGYSGSWGLG